MAAQRPRSRVPAIRATADALPLRDGAVDAAMAVLTLHHWDDACERGVREMRCVARDRVVIVTYYLRVSGAMWLMAEYLPEVATLDHRIFPTPERLAEWLGGRVAVEPLPIHRDSPDWMLGSFWAHPERVLDAEARAATSGFARMPDAVVDRVVAAIARDLADGSWDRRHVRFVRLRSTTRASASSSACLECARRGRDGRAHPRLCVRRQVGSLPYEIRTGSRASWQLTPRTARQPMVASWQLALRQILAPAWTARTTTFASSIIRQESRGGGGGGDFSVVVSLFLRRRKNRKIGDLCKNCAEILSWTLG